MINHKIPNNRWPGFRWIRQVVLILGEPVGSRLGVNFFMVALFDFVPNIYHSLTNPSQLKTKNK